MEEISEFNIDEAAMELPAPPPASPYSYCSFPYTFDGIKVFFPYKAYESQVQIMGSIIKGLNGSQHCLLESPAGTGKTAALLCATLAWQNDYIAKNPGQPLPVILYASRTHSQLNQVVDQLKKTAYRNTLITILAGRRETFLNDSARFSSSRDDACVNMGVNHNNPGSPRLVSSALSVPRDLEEHSNKTKSCAFCEGKAMKEQARVMFCTYNQVLNPQIRNALGIELEGKIVIFDDGHNIESNCMEIASRKISLESLENIIRKLNEASVKLDIPQAKRYPLHRTEAAITGLRNWMMSQLDPKCKSKFKKLDEKLEVKQIASPHEVFSAVGFGPDATRQLYNDLLILEDRNVRQNEVPAVASFKVDGAAMRAINSILSTFQDLHGIDSVPSTRGGSVVRMRLNHYSFDLVKPRRSTVKDERCELTLSLNCLSPHVTFQDMKRARTVIVTSATLSPMSPFSSELGVKFQHQLSIPRVIGSDRIFAAVISSYEEEKSSTAFKFDYKSTQNEKRFPEQVRCLGRLLIDICEKINFGVLVFFPSKKLARKCKDTWQTNGTMEKLMNLKRPFFEHEADAKMIEEYKSCAQSTGAVMFAHLRGTISEGIDLADNHARAVVIVGIPYAPCKELSIVRKRGYNDSRIARDRGLLCDRAWYNTNAFRAVNQGFGRCIRHSRDWGVLFMVDGRYEESLERDWISAWVKGSVRTGSTRNVLETQLDAFLRSLREERDSTAGDADTQDSNRRDGEVQYPGGQDSHRRDAGGQASGVQDSDEQDTKGEVSGGRQTDGRSPDRSHSPETHRDERADRGTPNKKFKRGNSSLQ